MNQKQFLDELNHELTSLKISDKDEIIAEYEQHFKFKLTDGFSEEEIIAKFDEPKIIARQFDESSEKNKTSNAKKVFSIIWLAFTDMMAGIFGIFLLAWELVMAAFSISVIVIAFFLFAGLNMHPIIPFIPYWCGAVIGISFAALAVLTSIGCIYFYAFIKQLYRAYKRFHNNVILYNFKGLTLPSLAIHPQVQAKLNRRMRTIALISLAIFAVSFIGGFAVSALSAGAFEFWHVWHWFQ